MDIDPSPSPNTNANISYDIVTIIRKKLVFAKRPIPIVPGHLKGIGSVNMKMGGEGEE